MNLKTIMFAAVILLLSFNALAQNRVFGDEFLYAEEEYAYAKKYLADGKFETAISAYRQLLEDYPKTSYQSEAMFMIGYIYNNNLNDTAKAAQTYRNLIKLYPKSEFAPSAKFELEHLGQPDFLPEFDNIKE